MTGARYGDGLTQQGKRLEGSLYHVMRIGRAERFCQHVRYPGTLQHRPHRTSGDHPRTMSSRLYQHLSSTFLSQLIVRDRSMHYRNLDQVLFRILDALGDRFLYLLSLPQTMTDY